MNETRTPEQEAAEDVFFGREVINWARWFVIAAAVVLVLAAIAADLGCSLAQLAIAWCLTNERVSSVILGASRASQLTENLAALDVLEKLDGGVLESIEGILDNKPEPPQEF